MSNLNKDELTHIINDAAIQLIQTNQAKLTIGAVKSRMYYIGFCLVEAATNEQKIGDIK